MTGRAKMTKQMGRRLREMAYVQGLPWAAWAKGEWDARVLCEDCGAVLKSLPAVDDGKHETWCHHGFPIWEPDPVPLEIPESIEAWCERYISECDRRGISPGELPMLVFPEEGDDEQHDSAYFIGEVSATINIWDARCMMRVHHDGTVMCHMDYGDAGMLRLLARYAEAIERADKDQS